MNQLDPVPVEKTAEESIGWKSESSIKEMFKDHNFIGVGGGERLTECSVPPNEILLQQDEVCDHLLQLLLRDHRFALHLLWIGDRS